MPHSTQNLESILEQQDEIKLPWKGIEDVLLAKKIDTFKPVYKNIGYYDLLYTWVDQEGKPRLFNRNNSIESPYAVCFTDISLPYRRPLCEQEKGHHLGDEIPLSPPREELKLFMLGDLALQLKNMAKPTPILINPRKFSKNEDSEILADEVFFAPIFDTLTKKFMMTKPEEALALLAINPDDQERFGIEMVFHMITNDGAPEEKEQREQYLRFKIAELAFAIPRVPIKKGSASIYCVMVNLGNVMEEMAFIRDYRTFDSYSDVIFVNSNLELLSGKLEAIDYNGEQIDTIFAPIIKWQKTSTYTRNLAYQGLHH